MATAKRFASIFRKDPSRVVQRRNEPNRRRSNRGGPPRRIKRKVALALVLIAAAVLAWFWHPLKSYAVTGAAYGARIGCACRYVEGRDIGACRNDFESGMHLVRLTEDPKAKTVTAGFPLLVHQTASFQEGQGCVLEKWAD